MSTPLDLHDLETRPIRYWHVDGLPELVMGLVWLIWGGALLVGEALPRGTVANLFWTAFPAILVLSGVVANWAVRQLKSRVTYPRTGYVAYPEPSRWTRLTTAAIAVITAAVVAGLAARAGSAGLEQTIAPIIGVLLSLAFTVTSVRQRAPHLLALAGVALALGVAVGALGLGWPGLNWLFVWLGAASVAVGAGRLRGYLRRHPAEVRG